MASSDEEPVPIDERVRFWEEQDRINQELIPRVIRQGELISSHVAEHDNLQAIVADAVRQAVTQTLAEQKEIRAAELDAAKAEMRERMSEALRQQALKTRNMLIGAVAVAVAVILAAVALAVALMG